LLGAQVTEISRQFGPLEITSICVDFLVELRGFEMMTIGRCLRALQRALDADPPAHS
jgi:hypothetical protein